MDCLAEPADLALWIGVPDDDRRMLAALRSASARFRGAVRWHVTYRARDEMWLDSRGGRVLHLPTMRVDKVHRVVVDGVELDPSGYRWSVDGLLERVGGVWPTGYRTVLVVADHGYDPIPDDIQEAVIDLARLIYATKPGISSMQVGGITTSFSTGGRHAVGTTEAWEQAVAAHRIERGDRA